jgi:Fe-S-cluster containining protein
MSLSSDAFKCQHCGACCHGHVLVTEDDLLRWAAQGRDDILSRVSPHEMVIGPLPRDEAKTCPYLITLPEHGICLCGIHRTKPDVCAGYPVSAEQARRFGCPGLRGPASSRTVTP